MYFLKHLTAIAGLLSGSMALAQDAALGEELYLRYCVSCHGVEATGHGPLRPVLLVPPTDLTGLAAQNGGVFPMERVLKRIDGRDPLVSHGREMPVYGPVFDGPEEIMGLEGAPLFSANEALGNVLAYLVSLQKN